MAPTRDSLLHTCAAAALAGGAAVLMSACQFSIGGGLDYDKLERAITDELNRSYASIDQQVSGVECPEQSSRPGKGDTFDCTAQVGGQTVRVESTVTDDDYNVDFSTRDTLYELASTATTLSEELSNQLGFPVTVDCGDGLKAVEVGDTFDCTAADDTGAERTVRITAAPAGENDSWELLE
ncbi:DUF4333 domain-containing protein [Mycobacterium sp. smrl_JER01]|uniref:DUF4333 domain-containing protein n=1 Tax=Mycobacterium sp. smrl_JER01 TaxID=3402633 RepID=UPI003AC0D3D9